MINPITEQELIEINDKIMQAGKQKILNSIDSLTAWNFRDLKALSSILDESFKQNRLLEGKSTANLGLGLTDIYDKILEKSQQKQIG
jgi:tRNA G37 N-methylase TrmD